MFDVVVLGGGAAGLMCAMRAGQRGRKVLLLDHAEKVGKKILISGGGRCNFTNLDARPEAFLSANPHFCKSALARYTQHDFIELVNKHRIAWHEKTLGQLFCDGSARQIVAMLLDECAAVGVDVRVAHKVTRVEKSDRFTVATDHGDFSAASVVLATGGLSIPKMGATGFAHEVARHFKLRVTETRPALVPLTLPVPEISGVALDVEARCGRARFREALLFTHRGLSGPAILQVSSYWKPGQEIVVDLLPDLDAASFLKERKRTRPKAELRTILAEIMPQRLAQSLAPEGIMANQRDRDLDALTHRLKLWTFVPNGTEGYAKAEVTLGGIDTDGLSSKTMEAQKVPGLYAIGEAVDVTGWLGGYNFQWAWSSGWVAGEAV
ncbi:NAD(P)/FAD-dependent oxidoreductase [Reyranella aquatilis]|uniref:NAD(P)/FAD-dependent oxidoreductase n=1 Tax=Reyranella aquatilis TaxID=2035356 RepID=A0ABS8KWR8_9HYPH|nr:NAD(P)/FAD-dependent oxidoreductase [Reyranella aquatilis]MCC8430541.1 NAD(P)/FAD-dependent oxidoreductase [Reyranella aquatilis]